MRFFPKTIRSQIVAAFSACFIFMAAMIVVNYLNFHSLSGTMHFFDIAEELKSTILEIRRYEKNYFLFRQDFNYEENLTYTNRLALILNREKENLTKAIGKENYRRFLTNLDEYAKLMDEFRKTPCEGPGCFEQQSRIRGAGQNLLLLADQLVTNEKRIIYRRLQQLVPLPLISLVVLVTLLGFVVFFIGERIVRPLARITRESEAVARGSFQRITPFGEAGNEIHKLISALNNMMRELENRHKQLVRASRIAAIGTLTSGVAHELNNPINNISLILESLMEDEDTLAKEERLHLYQEAIDQSERASDIVKNLLEFSRANHPRLETLSLLEVVDKTARLLDNEIRNHKIQFVKKIQDGLPELRMDKSGLQQVLLNLFLNSIQAMPNGGELKVTIGLADTFDELKIDVEDTGAGIPEKDIDRIFDPFYTTKKANEGTGLGLSVSHSIIKNQGGRLKVMSVPGQGTCFSIFLPFNSLSDER